jgi:hypothetical protein
MTTTSPGGTRTAPGPDVPREQRPVREVSGRPTHLRLVPAEPARRPTPRRITAGRQVSAGRPQPPLRLTTRGRVVLRGLVVLVMVVLLAGAALTMAHRAVAADGPPHPVVVAHHVVLPGETLWGIATALAPTADPRDTIARIVEFNALPSSAVHAGQSLAIPPDLPSRR